MQRSAAWRPATSTVPFSILGRIGGDATTQTAWYSVPVVLPFSILGRIGGDATLGRSPFVPG